MSEEQMRCQAVSKSGTPCKNYARPGSKYCGVHAYLEEETEEAAVPAEETEVVEPDEKVAESAEIVEVEVETVDEIAAEQSALTTLLHGLEQLAHELQERTPAFVPPAFTPEGLIDLMKDNLDRFTPDMHSELLSTLKSNFEGTTPQDLVDPETWKGLWYILNYLAQAQAKSTLEYVSERLASLPGMSYVSSLPGMDTVSALASNLEGASPKDFVDPETWKGLYMVVNYTIRGTASDLKRKLAGEEEED
jgi:hypothetical protein